MEKPSPNDRNIAFKTVCTLFDYCETPRYMRMISLFFFPLVLHFWVFCRDLASLVRCYQSLLLLTACNSLAHSRPVVLFWNSPFTFLFNPHLSFYLMTLPPKKQAVQTERVSDTHLHTLVASEGETPHVQSNIIFLPSINLQSLAHFSNVLCCKICLYSLQEENVL